MFDPPRHGDPLRCPSCGSRLVEVERAEVLIDACPQCRGIWLDRGELDKILVKERQLSAADPDEDFLREVEGRRPSAPREERREYEQRKYDPRYDKRKRRKSMLEELFDF